MGDELHYDADVVVMARKLGIELPVEVRGHRQWNLQNPEDDRNGMFASDDDCRFCAAPYFREDDPEPQLKTDEVFRRVARWRARVEEERDEVR
jgi:hypothetical protein